MNNKLTKQIRAIRVICGLMSGLLFATTINIPADYSTIQAGLNAASEGDTVLVAAGTYTENITWPTTNSIQLIGSGEENCIIDGNQQASVIRFEEDLGGIIDTTTLITDFTIQNGYAQNHQNYSGGGIVCDSSSPSLENVTISGNSADDSGGGIYCDNNSSPSLVNCILWNDSPQEIYFYESGDPNSIMIAYSDFQGGEHAIVANNNGTVYWEDSNIDLDPLFVDAATGDYHLQESSPCIDAGTAFFMFYGDTLVDMNADEYVGDAPDMGAFEYGMPTGIDDNYELLITNYELGNAYPNPFNPSTQINYQLPAKCSVLLAIYNLRGQLVETLVNEPQNPGYYSVSFDGSGYSSGVYFYRISVETNGNSSFQETHKMVLLR